MPAGGFRTFVAGEVLDEGDINDFLMQGILVFGGSAARGSAIGTAVTEGMFSYLSDTNSTQYYDGTNWIPLTAQIGALTGTGGNSTVTSGGYRYHTFTSSGTFTASTLGECEVLMIGAGASGGRAASGRGAGGGGAGGIQLSSLILDVGSYTVTVGAGGAAATSNSTLGNPGNSSSFGDVEVPGGGAGAPESKVGMSGASAGGNGDRESQTPKALPGYGFDGGTTSGADPDSAGGGGGAGAAGASTSGGTGGAGGAGVNTYSTWASATSTGVSGFYGGGGGGDGESSNGAGGSGGGGAGGGSSGTANTGSGGGGNVNANSGAGGSGLVIVRYTV
jgi:hypothetical protein